METFSPLLAICAGNSPVPGEFPAQRPMTRTFDVFFDLRLNKRLSKQSRGWWFETPSRSLWRQRNGKLCDKTYAFFYQQVMWSRISIVLLVTHIVFVHGLDITIVWRKNDIGKESFVPILIVQCLIHIYPPIQNTDRKIYVHTIVNYTLNWVIWIRTLMRNGR